MCDLDSVYYCFKEQHKRHILENFNDCEDKLYYVDILEYKTSYKNFIKKLFYLLSYSENIKRVEYLEIIDLLTSERVIDRLNGLKRCKNYIKIK